MGYNTYFELEIIENDDYNTNHKKEIASIADYIYCFEESIKWYDHEKDMKEYSLKYPEIVFCLKGEGEESGDIWSKYFKNGRMQECKAKIVINDYDEKLLH